MGGTGAAYTFTKRALEAGKSVCTSNKALVAKYGPELMKIAKEKKINFLFEASCAHDPDFFSIILAVQFSFSLFYLRGIIRSSYRSPVQPGNGCALQEPVPFP